MIAAANGACAAGSTGLCLTLVLAGSLPRKLPPFQFFDGLIGLGTNAPPQFGQTFSRRLSTQPAQNVHSYVQMRASSESGGRALLHCSHVGRSSSIVCPRRSLMHRDKLAGRARHIERMRGMCLTVREGPAAAPCAVVRFVSLSVRNGGQPARSSQPHAPASGTTGSRHDG